VHVPFSKARRRRCRNIDRHQQFLPFFHVRCFDYIYCTTIRDRVSKADVLQRETRYLDTGPPRQSDSFSEEPAASEGSERVPSSVVADVSGSRARILILSAFT
jgi:hypothetical protein